MRILLVAAPTAPVRSLAVRLRDPDIEVLTASSAREALEQIGSAMPAVVIIDGSLAGREIFRLYGRLRATAPGAAVPIVFTAHDRSQADAAPTTAPDYYLAPSASLDHIEQVVFSFLPASLVEEEADEELPYDEEPPPSEQLSAEGPGYGPFGHAAGASARSGGAAATRPPVTSPEPARPAIWSELAAQLQTGSAAIGLAYLGIYLAAELLAASVDSRLGLVVHAGLLLAIFFHGANVPPGPERAFFWTLWLAPLTRIYGLAQPYAGAPPLTWWALTTIPMAVAGVVAMRLAGQGARESGLIPSPREFPIAIFMAPVGMTVGIIMYMLLDPRTLGRELAFGGFGLVALIVILNPGLVDELVFRGVLQRAVSGLLGSSLGVLYTALLYAPVLPAGLVSGGSFLGVVLTFAVGLGLSFLTLKTGSVLSAVIGHMSLALGLFIIGPYLAPGAIPPAPAAATPALPATKPALIASPTPGAPAPQVAPPPAAKPAGLAAVQQGQPSPGAQVAPTLVAPPQGGPTPTPFSLAPPLPTPTSIQSTPAPPGAATIPGPIVVVRGTGDAGARLRVQPGNSGSTIIVIPEYTPLTIIGQDRNVDGITWRNVRAPNGAEGWIAASLVTSG